VACGASRVVAAGDDEVHAGLVDEQLLASTGCITKEGASSSGPFGPLSFTSHTFCKVDQRWTATFDNFEKMLAHLDLRRLPGEPPSRDQISGMRFALRHTPAFDKAFCDLLDAMGWNAAAPANIEWE